MAAGTKIAIGIGAGFLLFSLLPIWRSGEKRGLNLWQFMAEHTIFSKQRQWIRLQDKQTGKAVWIELTEGEPRSVYLYTNGNNGEKVGLIELP